MKAILANIARSIWRGKARSLAVTLITVLKSLNDFSLSFFICNWLKKVCGGFGRTSAFYKIPGSIITLIFCMN